MTSNSIDCARKLLDQSLNWDVITWIAMVNGHANSGQIELARELFVKCLREMRFLGAR